MNETSESVSEEPRAAPRGQRAPLAPVWRYLIGVAAAVVGLLPWLVSGLRLPLQNLWAAEVAPQEMPLVLLPFSQYAVTTIPALLVVGGAVAGLVTRVFAPHGLGAVATGLVAVQGFAVAQTALAVRAGLEPRTESTLYLGGLVGLSVLAVLVSALALVLIARAPRAGALIGFGIGALLLAPWLDALVTASGTPPGDAALAALRAFRWVPPVLVGAAIAWAGLRTAARVVAALVVLLALWLVPALLTGVSSAVGTRILARDLPGMLEYGVGVFRAAATMPSLVVEPLVVAVVVAAAGLLASSVARERRRMDAGR